MTTGTADCVDVTWRPDGGELAFVSARHARADVDLVRDVYAIAPDGSGLRRVTDSRGDCALPAYGPDGAAVRHRRARPGAGRAGLRRAAARAVPGGRRRRPLRAAAGPGAAPPRRRDARDGRGRRRRAGRRAARGARWSCCACRWTAATPETLVDGPFTVRGFAAGGRRRRRRRRARPVGGRADRAHPGAAPAADRVRPPARARPAGCTGCASGRRPLRTATRCTAG